MLVIKGVRGPGGDSLDGEIPSAQSYSLKWSLTRHKKAEGRRQNKSVSKIIT